MSVWQYMALVEGYIKANKPDDPGKMTASEADEMWEWLQGR
jgi:hypothetical protein